MIDVIIVGLGVAGMAFCEELEAQGKTFLVINDNSQTSSNIAGGMYNPVVLKRFTPVWRATEQLELAKPFYKNVENKLGNTYDVPLRVFRKFASIEEQNSWFAACDKPQLEKFLSPILVSNTNPHLKAPFSFGEVKHTGRVRIGELLQDYVQYLQEKKQYIQDKFQHSLLEIVDAGVCYKNWHAKSIVFAEGFGLKQNPYFNYLPLQGAKGQLLTVKAPDLQINAIYKSAAFFIPLGEDLYKVGATYEHNELNNRVTKASEELLLERISSLTNMSLEVVKQEAGVRPTVKDRRPLVGKHPKHDNLYVLNGMGSRGVMIAPFAAKKLYALLYDNTPIPEEMDVCRFEKLFGN